MTIFEIAQLGVGAAAFLVALPVFRNVWKGDGLAKFERTWRGFWPYSETALQDLLRASLALYIAVLFVLIAYPSALLLPTAHQPVRFLLGLGTLVGVIGTVGMFGAAICIVLFNSPKRLVFPALRDQEGLLARRRRGDRRKPPKR